MIAPYAQRVPKSHLLQSFNRCSSKFEKLIGSDSDADTVTVTGWFAMGLPPKVLAPLFFADPAGAVIGKACTRAFPSYNRAWYGSKTVAGTSAIFAVTFASITFECSMLMRLGLAMGAAVGESIGGEYDNLVIALIVLGGWWVCV